MNIMNSIFNYEKKSIKRLNKFYLIVLIVITIIIILTLLTAERDYYYENIISLIDNKIVLIVEKKHINDIKNSKKILVNGIESSYSINKITPEKEVCLIDISLKPNIAIDKNYKYKILIRKEKIIEYIIRIIEEIS